MRIARAHDVVAGEIVVLARKEPVHFTRRNAQRSNHDGHGRGEVFAMSRARFEQEVPQRILAGFSRQVQGVGVARTQVALDA